MELKYDDWQKEFLKCETDKILCSGRQVGKSEICAADCGRFAVSNDKRTILIIAPTERQAYELFNKTLDFLMWKFKKEVIISGRFKPTKTEIHLKNGSRILCLPTGISGTGIRGYTIDRLYIDEASMVPSEVWTAVTPMLLTTGGKIVLLSTPKGAQGFFYDVWVNKDHAFDSFNRFSVNSEECVRDRVISESWTEFRRDSMMMHLEREKRRMSSREYAQEYLGEFIQEFNRFFPDAVIAKCCAGKRRKTDGKHYLGVDIARLGDDETTYEIVTRKDGKFIHAQSIIKKKQLTTATQKDIVQLDAVWKFRQIGIDAGAGSLGVGVLDNLLQTRIANKVLPMNNRAMAMNRDGTKSQRLFKEDLYNNLFNMMEMGEIVLLDDDEVIASLQSVQYEYVLNSRKISTIRIFGDYTHIVEGLVRASLLAKKDKTLNLWAASTSNA